jgi:predicted ATPase/sugar phosphate isomerase/epimerase
MAEPKITPTPYVFLSYASAEQDRALAVSDALQQAGITVWLDRQAITGGSSWSAAIVDGITGCAAFIVLGSAHAFRSPNVQRELNLAVEENRPLLPLLLEHTAQPREVRYALAGRQWVTLADRALELWLPEVLRALAGLGIDVSSTPGRPADRVVQEESGLTASAAVHLPRPRTSFLGRERELAEVAALLGTPGLLTLTGPGGTGKTRLALAAAARVASAYPDGVWFVDLSGVVDPAGVLPAMAVLLDVKENEGRSLAIALAAYLRRKRLLLVLDNFEQVIAATLVLYDLLTEAPGLTLLVTSRVLLHLEGEREYAVPPLPLPEVGAAAAPEQLATNPAVQLFVQRAQGTRADFALTAGNASVVAAICRRLDGLPLAIELAAARVKLLPPTQLLARLEQRLLLLSGGERNRPTRQQTLRNTIQWSWDLLTAPEQLLFQRLGVFTGSFTLEAAEAVCNTDGGLDVLEGLSALIDQSLVRQIELNSTLRFSLLATLQEFALERLEAAGEESAIRRAHCAYFCAVAEKADAAYWHTFRLQQNLLQPLDPERDNLHAALAWALSEQDAALGQRLGGALSWWLFVRTPGEAEQSLTRLLALPGGPPRGHARGSILFGAGVCAVARGDVQAMASYWEEAVVCFRATGNAAAVGRTLAQLATWLPPTASDQALLVADEALRVTRGVVDAVTLAYVEVSVGAAMLLHGGNSAAAREHMLEGLRVARALGADWITMFALASLGRLAVEQAQPDEARALLREGLPLAEATGDRFATLHALLQIAQLAASADDRGEAPAHWRRALTLAQEVGSLTLTVFCLVGIADLLTLHERGEQAVSLLAAGNQLRERVEQQAGIGPQFQATYMEALSAAQAALSSEEFTEAWAAGKALSLDQATDLALVELASLPVPSVSPAHAAP